MTIITDLVLYDSFGFLLLLFLGMTRSCSMEPCGYLILPGTHNLPFWRSDGVVMACLLHAGPVEFLYYWLHRALHHHYLYSRYHSHHHSSIVTEPITCKILFILLHIIYIYRERERERERYWYLKLEVVRNKIRIIFSDWNLNLIKIK